MVQTRRQLSLQVAQPENLQSVCSRLAALPQVDYIPVSVKEAAVLIPLFEAPDGELRVWLTQRSNRLNTHKGADFAAPHDSL